MTNEIKVSMPRHDNELLINSCANFGLNGFGRTAAMRITIRLNEIIFLKVLLVTLEWRASNE